MESARISIIISDVCKKYKIDYTSNNAKYFQFIEDANLLRTVYLQLREIIEVLKHIEERHNIDGLGKILEDDVLHLENIDHDIIRLAKKLNKEGEDENIK